MYTRSNEKIQYEDEIRDMTHDEFKKYCLKVSKEIDEYFNIKHFKYTGFDFNFKPYVKV